MLRTLLASAVFAAACMAGAPAAADTWPSRPLSLIVPWAAGGSTDTLARILAQDIGTRLHTSVVVENRPGAGGTIGSLYVAHARPDGYTFILGVSGDQIIAQSLYPHLPYSPSKDLTAVGLVAGEPLIIAGRKNLPAKTPQELVAQAKSGSFTFGTSGIGSTGHLAGELINRQTGTHLRAIPYKGAAPAVIDTIAGNVDLVITSPIAVIQQVKSGKIIPIAVTSQERLAALPQVPTLKESGIDITVHTWYMMMAPAKVPPAIIESMNKALSASLASPEVQAKIKALGAEPRSSTPEALAELLTAERARWGEVVRAAHITMQ